MLTGDRAKYLGMVFHRTIDRVLATLASLCAGALVLIVTGLGVFVAFKLWRRRRFFKELGRARISSRS
jgi:ABC-type spermidine/putrescine transport system permease subunit II